MLVTSRKAAVHYRARLSRAITHAEEQGRVEVAEAFAAEREALEHHIRGACACHLDALEFDFGSNRPLIPSTPAF